MGLVSKDVRKQFLHVRHDIARASPYSAGGTEPVLLETLCGTLATYDPVSGRAPLHADPRIPRVGRAAEPRDCLPSTDIGCYNRIRVRALIQASGEEEFCAGMAGGLDGNLRVGPFE